MTQPTSKPTREDPRLRKVATDFWFAVQRMARRGDGPAEDVAEDHPPDDTDDDGSSGVRVPQRPAPTVGSASADLDEPAG